MKDWQEKAVIEKAELDAKLERLANYIKSGEFSLLGEADQELLRRQLDAMEDYSEVLGERLGRA